MTPRRRLFAVFLFFLGACAPRASTVTPVACEPTNRARGVEWSAEGLTRLRHVSDSLGTAAFVLVTDDRVVASWGDTTHLYRIHSIRKSLMSALYGIYVEEGVIDTAATLAQLGIEEKGGLTEVERSARVVDLLRARSGVYIAAAGEVSSMREARPARHSHAPNTFWYYNNWDFNVLGTIFRQETGEDIFAAFDSLVARPVGMQDFDASLGRYSLEETSVHPIYSTRMSARDLARFGRLYLQGGCWNGRQVIPRDWARTSTSLHSTTGDAGTKSGYGFMFWITDPANADGIPTPSYTMSGAGGQRVTVFPELNTVVVHLMDTDVRPRRTIDSPEWDMMLRELMKARR